MRSIDFTRVQVRFVVCLLIACAAPGCNRAEDTSVGNKSTSSEGVTEPTDASRFRIDKALALLKLRQANEKLKSQDYSEAYQLSSEVIDGRSGDNEFVALACSVRSEVCLQRGDLVAAIADINCAIHLAAHRKHYSTLRGTLLAKAASHDDNPFLLLVAFAELERIGEIDALDMIELKLVADKYNANVLYRSLLPLSEADSWLGDNSAGRAMKPHMKAALEALLAHEYAAAEETSTRAIGDDERDAKAYFVRAVARVCRSTDHQAAMIDLHRALELDPELAAADDLMLMQQSAESKLTRGLPPSKAERISEWERRAKSRRFSPDDALRVAHHLYFIHELWGSASRDLREGILFGGLSHLDRPSNGERLMPLLVEEVKLSSRLRERQRLEWFIAELSKLGMPDPRRVGELDPTSTAELLARIESLRWDKHPEELRIIGRALANRPQADVDRVVKTWEESARTIKPSFNSGPTLYRYLTLQTVVREIGPAAIPGLIQMLRNRAVAASRADILQLLQDSDDDRIIEPIRAALNDGLNADADFDFQARRILERMGESVPEPEIDPSVVRIIKKVCVADPFQEDYIEFRGYERGLISIGKPVLKPLTTQILATLIRPEDIGFRQHDIGGTPARVIATIRLKHNAATEVKAAIDELVAALMKPDDQISLGTKWYVLCVLAEMFDAAVEPIGGDDELMDELSGKRGELRAFLEEQLSVDEPQIRGMKSLATSILTQWDARAARSNNRGK